MVPAPTASSTNDISTLVDNTRQSLKALDVQRKSLELEAEAITSELTQPPKPGVEPMGIDTPLVDSEGYPRADIDVYRARSLRGRLAELRTDHKALMKEIEKHLQQLAVQQKDLQGDGGKEERERNREEYAQRLQPKPKPKYDPSTGKWVVKNWDGTVAGIPNGDKVSFDRLHESASSANAVSASNTEGVEGQLRQVQVSEATDHGANHATDVGRSAEPASSLTPMVDMDRFVPFARVNSIADNSPASQAGLKQDDLIVQFGSIVLPQQTSTSVALQAVGELVPRAASSGDSIRVIVLRQDQASGSSAQIALQLTPRPWAGRGLLGCHVCSLCTS